MKKRLFVGLAILSAIAVLAVLVGFLRWFLFDIDSIRGHEVLERVDSPDGKYTITSYLNNGGATTNWAVLCSVKDNDTGKTRNIYWQYRCDDANITWIDDTTVNINGVKLNVEKDTYDFRYREAVK